MSFSTASAILRGEWLLDKQWATAHMPLVISFIKGDANAAATLMGGAKSSINDDNELEPQFIDGFDKVYEVCCGCNIDKIPSGSIAYLDINGPMLKEGDLCADGMEDYAELIDSLKNNSNVFAIIIDVDSPGGQASGTALFADSIKNCTSVKPVIGFIDDGIAASAAYWFISACSEIYVSQPTSKVGSIGAYCSIADWYAYYESQGLKVKDVYAPQSTDKNLDYKESIAGNDTLLEDNLGVLTDAFIKTITKNRAGKIQGKDWATGKMYFAADALKIGLIDGIKSFNQVVSRASTLINSKQKLKTTSMAFEKTLVAAKATEFGVTNEGFVLSEEQLNNIEQVFTDNATAESISADNLSLQEQLSTANNAIATLNSEKAIAENKIAELSNKIVVLGGQSSGNGTTITIKEDTTVKEEKIPSYLDDNNPANKWIDSRIKK